MSMIRTLSVGQSQRHANMSNVTKLGCFKPGKNILASHTLFAQLWQNKLPYFIEYNAHTSIVRTWISQWFLAKFYFYFSGIISQVLIIASIKSHLKPFLIYLPCIVHREYFSIIFNVKKCAQYLIKYSTCNK